MQFLKKNRFAVAIGLIIILGGGLIYLTQGYLHPLPEVTTFKSKHYSFDYPRSYSAHEYASGVVSVGVMKGDALTPYTEVTLYQSDPDQKTPPSFDTFVKVQAGALCGSDSPVESVTCTQIGVTPYTNANGEDGSKLDLTLIRKNLKTGTTTSSTYGPFYVFNTTKAPATGESLRYAAIFIHPSLSTFLSGTTTPELEQQIVSTLKVPGGVTRTIK
jgi:hypothetical protein